MIEQYPSSEDWQSTERIIESVLPHQRNLPYHGYDHPLQTYHKAFELVQLCMANGVMVDVYVITAATLHHDDGYWKRVGIDHDFKSKEKYSAYLANETMLQLGMDPARVEHTKSVIESTEAGVPCKSLEAKIVRRADLDNVADVRMNFLRSTLKLYAESALLSGQAMPTKPDRADLATFILASHKILSEYIAEDLSLGEFDKGADGRCPFNVAAAKNLEWMSSPDFLETALQEITEHPIDLNDFWQPDSSAA